MKNQKVKEFLELLVKSMPDEDPEIMPGAAEQALNLTELEAHEMGEEMGADRVLWDSGQMAKELLVNWED